MKIKSRSNNHIETFNHEKISFFFVPRQIETPKSESGIRIYIGIFTMKVIQESSPEEKTIYRRITEIWEETECSTRSIRARFQWLHPESLNDSIRHLRQVPGKCMVRSGGFVAFSHWPSWNLLINIRRRCPNKRFDHEPEPHVSLVRSGVVAFQIFLFYRKFYFVLPIAPITILNRWDDLKSTVNKSWFLILTV